MAGVLYLDADSLQVIAESAIGQSTSNSSFSIAQKAAIDQLGVDRLNQFVDAYMKLNGYTEIRITGRINSESVNNILYTKDSAVFAWMNQRQDIVERTTSYDTSNNTNAGEDSIVEDMGTLPPGTNVGVISDDTRYGWSSTANRVSSVVALNSMTGKTLSDVDSATIQDDFINNVKVFTDQGLLPQPSYDLTSNKPIVDGKVPAGDIVLSQAQIQSQPELSQPLVLTIEKAAASPSVALEPAVIPGWFSGLPGKAIGFLGEVAVAADISTSAVNALNDIENGEFGDAAKELAELSGRLIFGLSIGSALAAGGAAAGTIIEPGLGTALGGIMGGAYGYVEGAKVGQALVDSVISATGQALDYL